MHKIVPITAFLCVLTACSAQRSEVVSIHDESEESAYFDVYTTQLDTSKMKISADLDSPEFIVIHADSTKIVHVRARRMRFDTERSNGTAQSTQAHSDSTARSSTNINASEHSETETTPDWMEWIAYAAIIIYIVNRIRLKLSGSN